ncbi:MAG: tripartite tricarboxylate transporter permease [Candidatus Nanohaloarchaea archaeon]|nr:tripartite tricarboxylate transporter permease [Candidatus Nanohaloarchaea archaeon]
MLRLLGGGMAGIGCGVVTGLLPGLHPNSVIFLLLPIYFRSPIGPRLFVAFAAGMATVHTFVSFIPSIFVGAPEGDTALSTLPGHRFLHAGRGREAVELTVVGGLLATVLAVLALPLLFITIPPIYSGVASHMHLLLLGVLVYLTLDAERPPAAVVVILLAGVLGVFSLNSPLANTQYVLFPLFAGVFGLAIILESLAAGVGTPRQGRSLPVRLHQAARSSGIGFLAGILAGFLPGIGSSQSILLLQRAARPDTEEFLAALGGVTTTDLFISLAALYLIGNPRSGAAVAMQQVLPSIRLPVILQVLGMSLVGVGSGALITLRVTNVVVTGLRRVNYRYLLAGTGVFIAAGSVVLNGWFGLLVLTTAASLGVLTARLGVRRSTCMAVLIVPTIITYGPFSVSLF